MNVSKIFSSEKYSKHIIKILGEEVDKDIHVESDKFSTPSVYIPIFFKNYLSETSTEIKSSHEFVYTRGFHYFENVLAEFPFVVSVPPSLKATSANTGCLAYSVTAHESLAESKVFRIYPPPERNLLCIDRSILAVYEKENNKDTRCCIKELATYLNSGWKVNKNYSYEKNVKTAREIMNRSVFNIVMNNGEEKFDYEICFKYFRPDVVAGCNYFQYFVEASEDYVPSEYYIHELVKMYSNFLALSINYLDIYSDNFGTGKVASENIKKYVKKKLGKEPANSIIEDPGNI